MWFTKFISYDRSQFCCTWILYFLIRFAKYPKLSSWVSLYT